MAQPNKGPVGNKQIENKPAVGGKPANTNKPANTTGKPMDKGQANKPKPTGK